VRHLAEYAGQRLDDLVVSFPLLQPSQGEEHELPIEADRVRVLGLEGPRIDARRDESDAPFLNS
jgi:hypothetical protein